MYDIVKRNNLIYDNLDIGLHFYMVFIAKFMASIEFDL